MNYAQITICALLNIGAIAILAAADVRPRQEAWQLSQQQNALIQGDAAIEQQRIEAQRALADAHNRNGIAHVEQLILSDYTAGQPLPPLDWQNIVNPAQKTCIFDKHRRYIGYAYAGGFFSVQQFPGDCQP